MNICTKPTELGCEHHTWKTVLQSILVHAQSTSKMPPFSRLKDRIVISTPHQKDYLTNILLWITLV